MNWSHKRRCLRHGFLPSLENIKVPCMPGQLVPDTSPHPLPKSSDAQVCRYKNGAAFAYNLCTLFCIL